MYIYAGTLWKTIQDAHESEINDVAACQGNDTFCTVSADSLGYVWQLESAELCGVCRGSSAGTCVFVRVCMRVCVRVVGWVGGRVCGWVGERVGDRVCVCVCVCVVGLCVVARKN